MKTTDSVVRTINPDAPRFRDIPQLTRTPTYGVDVDLRSLLHQIDQYVDDDGLDLLPDFQRGHIWDDARRAHYVEFLLRGGKSNRTIYFNCPGWMRGERGEFVIVDGLQRLTACMRFLHNQLKVFGRYHYGDFVDELWLTGPSLRFEINDLPRRADVLRWYLEINAGQVAHTADELNKVRTMLALQEGEPSLV